jgi:hypothetical protein
MSAEKIADTILAATAQSAGASRGAPVAAE